jgi:uncharacterized protein with GYD domain
MEACPSENPDRFTSIDHMHQKKYNALAFHMNSYMNQYLKEGSMATYLMLLNWTDQGIKNVKESPKRMDAAKKLAKDFGGEIKTVYMTQGSFDLAFVTDMPNDEKVASFVLKLGSLGNVRTTTLKAYSEDDYRNIIGNLT